MAADRVDHPKTQDNVLERWKSMGLIASMVIVLTIPIYAVKESYLRPERGTAAGETATFVGRDSCISCHDAAYQSWLGSDHDHSMAVADESMVRGDFDDAEFEHLGVSSRFYRRDGRYYVHTEGPDGEMGEFEVAYTFGIEPLQQYLIPFPGGRLQCLSIAWDGDRGRWFHLYPDQNIPPDDWLHWTRNAQNWNGMCAECHSTNLIKGYDPDSQTFSTTWSEIDVSCETCHGPGSRHVEWAEIPPMARPETDNYELVIRTSDITSRQQVELCAPCHSRRTELGDYDHRHMDFLDNLVPSVLEESLYHADGQILEEVYVYGSFVQSKMFQNDVRCSDCHDVHSLKLVQEGNELCLQCHRADAYDSIDHHFHQKQVEGEPSEGALCVKCHMPESPYMVIDYRADHSIRVPRPDLSRDIGTPNACSQDGCHHDKPLTWLIDYYDRWYGRAKKPHYGTILAAGREQVPEAREQLIRLAGDELYPAIVRSTALSLLGAYPGEESTRAYNRALSDVEALVRYTAVDHVDALGLSDERMVELVSPLLFDPVRAVRMLAATKLAGLPDDLFAPYQKEAFTENLDDYMKTMEYALDFSYAGLNLGNLYSRLGENEKAVRYYEAAVEIDDLFYPAKMNLAVLYNSMGRNEEAESLLREVLVGYPEQYDAAYSLGLLMAEMNRYDEAVRYLEIASQGMPGRSRIHYNLGLALQVLGRNPEAVAALEKALGVEPDNLEYLYALADHYIKQEAFQEALAVTERMIAAHPDNPVGRDLKANIERVLMNR
jgi:predicted CXXCH cytochrome family protein